MALTDAKSGAEGKTDADKLMLLLKVVGVTIHKTLMLYGQKYVDI